MVRLFSFLVGLGFVGALIFALYTSIVGVFTDREAESAAAALHLPPKALSLPSDGLAGRIDAASAQRGFQIYKEVCANCHSLHLVAFRDLEKLGYSQAEVKKIAADWGTKQSVLDPKSGDRSERANTPADHIPTVYYPGQGNPPDLSLIAKARHGGGAYVYSLLTGYRNPTAKELAQHPDAKPGEGLYFNPYFANLNIAMPPPLMQDGQITYADGTKSTVDQNARDVAEFLVWAAEPNLNTRHQIGFVALGFLAVATLLAFGAYRNIWRNVKH